MFRCFVLLSLLTLQCLTVEDNATEFEFFKSNCDPSCVFEPYHVDSESIKLFPTTCSTVCAYLVFDKDSDVTENQLGTAFQNLKVLYGFIHVLNTDFLDMKFLSSLETLECEGTDMLRIESNKFMTEIGMTNLTSTSCGVEIGNYCSDKKEPETDMERLNLPNLKNFYTTDGRSTLYFQIFGPSNSTYCLTVGEVTNFINSDYIKVPTIIGKYCNDSVPERLEEKVCVFEDFQSLADFDTTCKRVFGDVVIKVGDEEHVEKLRSVTWIYGTITIRQTNLTSIDFFDSLETVISLEHFEIKRPIQISYNLNLKTAVFPRLKKLVPLTGISFDFRGNNPEISSNSTFCFTLRRSLAISETRHVPVISSKTCDKSCIFEPYHMNSESLKVFPTSCTSVCAYLLIDRYSDVTESQLTIAFQNIKVLFGFLHVLKTNFRSLEFLKNLETLECDENEKLWVDFNLALKELAMTSLQSTSCSIDIGSNSNMTRLGLPKLKHFYKLDSSSSMLTIAISNSAFEFCVTIEEMTNFFHSNVTLVETIYGSYCNETSFLFSDQKFCATNDFNLESLDHNCQRIFGSVLVKNGDEDYVKKLNSVSWIYGDLEIRDTNLTDIDFLENLEYVISLEIKSDPKASIRIHDNPALVNMSFPRLKKVKTRSYYAFTVDDNNEALSLNLDLCLDIQNSIVPKSNFTPMIDRKSCDQIQKMLNAMNSTVMESSKKGTGNRWKIIVKKHEKKVIMGLLGIPILFGLLWEYLMLNFVSPFDKADRFLVDNHLDKLGVSLSEVKYAGIYFWPIGDDGVSHIHLKSTIGMFIMFLIILLSLTIILVFGHKCYVETCKLLHNASQSSSFNKLQSQLFHALVLQTIIPLLLMHLPAAFGFSASFFNVSFELLGDICSFTIYLYPTLDPLPNFFIIKNYRETILGAFRVFKVKIVGFRTAKVEVESVLATKLPSALTLI